VRWTIGVAVPASSIATCAKLLGNNYSEAADRRPLNRLL
jgi:hypothetical protein